MMGPDREVSLDLEALRHSAANRPSIQRNLVLGFVSVAERCLPRLSGLIIGGDQHYWRVVVEELEGVAIQVHARQIAGICRRALGGSDDHVARLGTYLEIREAYDSFLTCARNAGLLNRYAEGG